jgi:hypothetical protein
LVIIVVVVFVVGKRLPSYHFASSSVRQDDEDDESYFNGVEDDQSLLWTYGGGPAWRWIMSFECMQRCDSALNRWRQRYRRWRGHAIDVPINVLASRFTAAHLMGGDSERDDMDSDGGDDDAPALVIDQFDDDDDDDEHDAILELGK